MKCVVIGSLVVAGALAMGCNKEDEKRPASSAPPAVQPGPTTGPSGVAMPPMPSTMPSEVNAAGTDASKATADAQGKLDQVMQYIKDKKYDLAEKTLSELESKKSSLPAQVQSQLPNARVALNAAKMSGGDMKMPSMPR